jgi:hypothetical protein
MGATFRDVCYPVQLDAAAAVCSAEFPRTDITSGGDTRVQSCTVVDDSTLQVTTYIPATAASAAVSVPVSFASCDPNVQPQMVFDIWQDGLVAVCLVLVTKLLMRPFISNT